MARLVVLLLALVVSFTCSGCGGGGDDDIDLGAGVQNGGIVGKVQGAGAQGVLPILGATVVAVRQDNQPFTRSTQSDQNGDFVLSDLPLGRWRVGYSADGFAPIPAQSGGAEVFVESGRFAQVPPVILSATTGGFQTGGPSNLLVTLLDAATGEPINGATVTAGVAATSASNGGVYSLSVPGQGQNTVGLSAQAEGYDPQSLTPREVTVVQGGSVQVTARLGSVPAGISGRIVVPGAFQSQLSTVEIRVLGIAASFTNANINPTTGSFRLTVPASNSFRTRVFTITFVSPFFNVAAVSGVVAPQGGSLTLPQDVVLTPIGVGVTGTVVDSISRIPGPGSTVTIRELGISAPIVAGQYTFGAVPMGLPLTFVASVINGIGQLETGSVVVTPTINGGVFVVPTIISR
jgi:hypothetical protein